jgi:hypothetical protein
MYKCPKRSVKRAIVYLENCLEILCYLTEICSNERGGLVAYNEQVLKMWLARLFRPLTTKA